MADEKGAAAAGGGSGAGDGEVQWKVTNVRGRQYRKAQIGVPPFITAKSKADAKKYAAAAAPKAAAAVWQEYDADEAEADAAAVAGLKLTLDPVTQRYTYRQGVSPNYYPFLIGKERKTISAIQSETGAIVTVPGPRDRSEVVVISGATEKSVAAAKARIDQVIEQANESMEYTHFVCVPLSSAALQSRYGAFVGQALALQPPVKGLDASLFTPPSKLHLTCILLKLLTPQRVEKATNVLKQLQPEIAEYLKKKPVALGLKGVEIMNDEPAAAQVLHMKVTPNEELTKLKHILKLMIDAFVANEVMPQSEVQRQRLLGPDPNTGKEVVTLKWHLTLVNTKHRREGKDGDAKDQKGGGGGGGGKGGKSRYPARVPFDAGPLLQAFGALDFGTEPAPFLHLSQRGAADASGGYKCVLAVPLV